MTDFPQKVLVIGLDGATFDLIEPWAAAGLLPNLSRLMAEGSHGQLLSTLQPVTAPAWTTFMTGVNQGKHGLYDFIRRRADSYELEITSAAQIALPNLFELASQQGRRVISVNVPYTFPPRAVNGICLAGPFAPAFAPELVYPAEIFPVIFPQHKEKRQINTQKAKAHPDIGVKQSASPILPGKIRTEINSG